MAGKKKSKTKEKLTKIRALDQIIIIIMLVSHTPKPKKENSKEKRGPAFLTNRKEKSKQKRNRYSKS